MQYKAYKLLFRLGDRLVGSGYYSLPKELRVYYRARVTMKPPIGGFFIYLTDQSPAIFLDEDHAWRLMITINFNRLVSKGKSKQAEIWEARPGEIKLPDWDFINMPFTFEKARRKWEKAKLRRFSEKALKDPKTPRLGTQCYIVVTDKLALLRPVVEIHIKEDTTEMVLI